MERYQKAAVWTLIVYFVWCSFVMLTEVSLIPEQDKILYLITKSLCILPALPLAYWLKRDGSSQTAHTLVGVAFMSYAVQGQCFRPLYYLSFFQLAMAYSFLFTVSKARFAAVVGAGIAAFAIVLRIRWESFVVQNHNPVYSDLFLGILSVGVVAFLSNIFVSSERSFREDALKKFGHIGAQTARVVHDLKGLIAAPKIYVQMLQSKMSSSEDAEALEALELLSRDLEGFKMVLYELNQLSGTGSTQEASLSLEEVIASVRVLLKKQLSGVTVESSAQVSIVADRTSLGSMLMNLFLNSVDAFKADNTPNPKIRIEVIDNRVLFQDNGGGFQKRILDSIAKGNFTSTRAKGSGLGLFFVFDGMKKLGGKVKVYNTEEGACVEFIFPRSCLESN